MSMVVPLHLATQLVLREVVSRLISVTNSCNLVALLFYFICNNCHHLLYSTTLLVGGCIPHRTGEKEISLFSHYEEAYNHLQCQYCTLLLIVHNSHVLGYNCSDIFMVILYRVLVCYLQSTQGEVWSRFSMYRRWPRNCSSSRVFVKIRLKDIL